MVRNSQVFFLEDHIDIYGVGERPFSRQALTGTLLSRGTLVLEGGASRRVGSRGVHRPVPIDDGVAPGASECEVVGTGPVLSNLEPGSSSGNEQDLLVAQRAPPVSEIPRDKPAGRIVAPTDTTAIRMLA